MMDFPADRKRSDVFRIGPKPKTLRPGEDYHLTGDGVSIHPTERFTKAATVAPSYKPHALRRKQLRVRQIGKSNRVTSK